MTQIYTSIERKLVHQSFMVLNDNRSLKILNHIYSTQHTGQQWETQTVVSVCELNIERCMQQNWLCRRHLRSPCEEWFVSYLIVMDFHHTTKKSIASRIHFHLTPWICNIEYSPIKKRVYDQAVPICKFLNIKCIIFLDSSVISMIYL